MNEVEAGEKVVVAEEVTTEGGCCWGGNGDGRREAYCEEDIGRDVKGAVNGRCRSGRDEAVDEKEDEEDDESPAMAKRSGGRTSQRVYEKKLEDNCQRPRNRGARGERHLSLTSWSRLRRPLRQA